ncbi:MAG: Eco57I restriction-modification methylase domain-containing protein [Syntrophales bacterium]|nr:Eco57I restriction-modification methylase domain-containing protein [Syntrophales bacterium]
MDESIRKNARLLDEKLETIKICDPAIGSGAFPVGMMHEIVKARNVLETYLKTGKSAYNFKRHCIQESIYGVDIDPGAIEIAKLRLWLSLVVDEENYLDIKPLPNLDYKIVCGNSLLSVEKNLFNEQLFTKLEELKPIYFDETNVNKKPEYKKQIDDLIKELTNNDEHFDFEIYFSEVFHKQGGFDVVIANPPYIKEYTDRNVFDGLRTLPYYQGKMDIWYFFGCVGLDILTRNGTQCFIAPNNWISNAGASIFRNKIIKEAQIIQFIDFGNYKIFESADIQTMVYLLQKSDSKQAYELSYSRLLDDRINTRELEVFLNSKHSDSNCYKKYPVLFDRSDNQNDYIRFSQKDISMLLNKIQDQDVTFLYEDEVAQGIVAPQDFLNRKNAAKLGDGFNVGDGIFVLSDEEKRRINWTERELEIIKPYYTTAELQRYFGNTNNNCWLIYAKSDMNREIKNYPNIKRHLDKFKSIITSDFGPYGLHRARNEKFLKDEKIVSARKCARPTFTYSDFDCYVSQTFFVIKTERFDLKYLTAILNSKLIEFWLLHKGKLQGNQYQVDKIPLLKIPLKKLAQSEAQPLITLADQILSLKKSDPQADTSALETEIDRMVYKLYNLTAEEIAIVEESEK